MGLTLAYRHLRITQMADDSRVSVSSASSTASSAKQSFSDEFTGVRAFCIIFSRNILNNTGDNYINGWCRVVVAVNSPMRVNARSCMTVSEKSDSKYY